MTSTDTPFARLARVSAASAASVASVPVFAGVKSYAHVAAAACDDHDAVHARTRIGSQGPRRRQCTKEEGSRPSEDKNSAPRGTGTYLRTAGVVRGPVVGSSPGRRGVTKETLGAVTPSVHLGVPESLFVTPGRGKGLRQQLGWKKVLGTADSGIWVLKGESRGYTLPSI